MSATTISAPAKSSPTERARRPMLFWALLVAVGAVGTAAFAGLRAVAGGSGPSGGDMTRRMDRVEEQIESLAALPRGAPRFLVDPARPANRAGLDEAVAALSQELGDLRKQMAELRGDPPAPVAELVSAGDPKLRRRAIRELRDLAKNDPEARKELRRLLGDRDAGVRAEALDALRKAGDPAALTDVMALLADSDSKVRGRAAQTAADLAEQSADPADKARTTQALQALLADGKDSVREDAVDALRDIGGKEAVPGLVRALQDKDMNVQERAIEGLGRSGDPSAVGSLRQAYGDGGGPNALRAAVALKRLGDGAAFAKETVRLRGLFEQGGSSDDKRDALRMLAEHAPAENRALFERALRDPSDRVRREAQRALDRSAQRPR